jgi:hypothetical protein
VLYDSVPASPENPTALISINSWKLSLKTDYEDVSCFLDTNKVYVPGLRDISGTFGGFWNSSNVVLIEASNATTPGFIKLTPNTTEPSFYFGGLAYIDADIDCSLVGAEDLGDVQRRQVRG